MRLARLKPFARRYIAHSAFSARLRSLEGFGSNPGDLGAWCFVPPHAADLMPLVVVLHGCTQTVHGYDIGSGWSTLAEAHGFAVLYPEQRLANNPNGCFNWFESVDTRRSSGEAQSIAQMVDAMIARHSVDPARVFITGLSAGGAMTSVMLAAYPDKFAAGAIIAGLPHGAATSVQGAFQQMRAHAPSGRTTGAAIKGASPHRGPWPTVSIWHGTADSVVDLSNADAIGKQWREVHGLADAPSETGMVDGHPYSAWRDAVGRVLVEDYRIIGLGHGVPLAASGGLGEVGAFMLEAGISSTVHSARTWGLLGAGAIVLPAVELAPSSAAERGTAPAHAHSQVGQIIEQALRSAGLMR